MGIGEDSTNNLLRVNPKSKSLANIFSVNNKGDSESLAKFESFRSGASSNLAYNSISHRNVKCKPSKFNK